MTAVKHKVKYSVDYDSSTDTLSEKLNTLLNSIITLMRTNNPEILELSRITYGSEEMTDAPLYNTGDNGTRDRSFRSSHYVQNGGWYQSDLVFLGLSKNNLVLSIGFIDNKLVIAMNIDPSIESIYADNWDTIRPESSSVQSTKMFAVGLASRYSKAGDTENLNDYNLFFPFIISNKKIEISVVYWTGNNSSGYMFYNAQRLTNDVDLVFYKSLVNGNNSLCCALYRFSKVYNNYIGVQPQLLTFSFDENVSENLLLDKRLPCFYGDNINYIPGLRDNDISDTVDNNSKFNLRLWFALPAYTGNSTSETGHIGRKSCLFMGKLHTLGILNPPYNITTYPSSMPNYDNVKTLTHASSATINTYFISAMCGAYSLPYLEDENEVYLRQVRVPGFIDSCYGELYMMWTPSIQSYKSGDIVEIDDDKYAVINEGVVCWVTKI